MARLLISLRFLKLHSYSSPYRWIYDQTKLYYSVWVGTVIITFVLYLILSVSCVYNQWISDHLPKAAGIAPQPKTNSLFEEANGLVEKTKMDLSIQEEQFLRQSLATLAITYPKLLIKYHKTTNKKGWFKTRLVIPATNLTTRLSNLGYLRIKIMMDKANMNYLHIFIVQASDLEDTLESL